MSDGLLSLVFFFFFFSSRRRHTRCSRDWSSDVCSSDLSCLSGGIDASTVVSLIGKIWREQPDQATALGDRFLTFTSCWKYPELDERTYADRVARAAGAESHLVFPSAQDFWETFPKMAWHQDMPFASLSYYAQC